MISYRACGCASLLALVALLAGPITLAAQQRGRAATAAVPGAGIRGFSVVLVIGNMQGSGSADGVPDAARKALADMKEFLPFKRYQLLDAAWMLCCASGRGSASVSGRVRGPDNGDYTYVIDPVGASDTRPTLHFTLRETAARGASTVATRRMSDSARLEHSRELYDAIRERDDAQIEYGRATQRFNVGVIAAPDMEKAKQRMRRAQDRVTDLQAMADSGETADQLDRARTDLAALERRLGSKHPEVLAKKREIQDLQASSGGRPMIDSTFSISPGETVVIGTSRLMGDQALIAILTAATGTAGTR